MATRAVHVAFAGKDLAWMIDATEDDIRRWQEQGDFVTPIAVLTPALLGAMLYALGQAENWCEEYGSVGTENLDLLREFLKGHGYAYEEVQYTFEEGGGKADDAATDGA